METEDRNSPEPVEVPPEALQEDVLNSLLESFVLREGTDYGHSEFSLEDKVKHVRRQLQRGEIKIVFDPLTESVNLLTVREYQKHYGRR